MSRLEVFVIYCVPERAPVRFLATSESSCRIVFTFGFVGDRPVVVLWAPKPGHKVLETHGRKSCERGPVDGVPEMMHRYFDTTGAQLAPGDTEPGLIGPFIMDFVRGQNLQSFLSDCLKKPDGTEREETIYTQMARFHLSSGASTVPGPQSWTVPAQIPLRFSGPQHQMSRSHHAFDFGASSVPC